MTKEEIIRYFSSYDVESGQYDTKELLDQYANQQSIEFAEWIAREGYSIYYPGDDDKPEWISKKQMDSIGANPTVVFTPTTTELLTLYKQSI